MASYAGKNGIVKSSTTAVAEVQAFTLTETAETVDATSMGDTWRDHHVTFRAWEASIECFWDPDDAGQNAYAVGSTVTVGLYPEADGSGAKYASGSATVTEKEVTAEKEGVVSAALTVVGKGALTWSTVGA